MKKENYSSEYNRAIIGGKKMLVRALELDSKAEELDAKTGDKMNLKAMYIRAFANELRYFYDEMFG